MHGRESLEESIITNSHLTNLHQSDDRDIGFYFHHQLDLVDKQRHEEKECFLR